MNLKFLFVTCLLYGFISLGLASTPKTTSPITVASALSDIQSSGGESATISSLENDSSINTSADGTQVWQFTIRDGGPTGDTDNFPTIINSIILSQNVGNEISDWSDAIQAVALFNGNTKIADGVVSTNQILFSGVPLLSVPDDGSLTLSLRLSVQTNPNNSGGNLDGEDFVFNLTHSNLTTNPAGSGFTTFDSASSINNQNTLTVIGTQLAFNQHPESTAINSPMTTVKTIVTDANGNIDLGFTGIVSITSSGIMSGSVSATAITGLATFNGIIHTALANGLTLTASATGIALATSTPFNIILSTNILPGDVAILAVNTAAANTSDDEISFVCFVDILPGTQFYLTDNGYERVNAGKWGNTEGIISLTRTTSTLPQGAIITIYSSNNGISHPSDFKIKICGVEDTNWNKGVVSNAAFNLTKDDQVWIMQGGVWTDAATGNHDATYSGNVLYGWTNLEWKTAANYASTSGSAIYPKRECFTIDVPNTVTTAAQVKFNDPNNPDFSSTANEKLDWIALINNPANWDSYTSDSNYDSGGYDYAGSTICPALNIASNTHQNGKWTGQKDTNWFNCGNWDTLLVPDETVDVLIEDNTFDREAIIENTAPNASYYDNIAKTKNLTITGEKVEISASANHTLEVHGNLLIDSAGIVDMDDSTTTPDGQLYLYGNWTNNGSNSSFQEGNGTVHFLGNTPQIINNNNHSNPEEFYNLVLDNDFNTAVSNHLIASNEITINTGKTVTVTANDFIQASKNIHNSGTLEILHQGSLVMLDDSGTVTNSGVMNIGKTTTPFEKYDYTYWSAPIENPTIAATFTNWNTNYAFYFDPTKFEDLVTITNGSTTVAIPDGFDDNQDDWQPATTTMSPGKGYSIMESTTNTFPATETVTFSGTANNGIIATPVNLTPGTPTDDDWNLIGNPYPSAISADYFINANIVGTGSSNQTINGTLYFWTHKANLGGDLNLGPNALNFSQDDYAVYTLAGGTGTSGTIAGAVEDLTNRPSGFIASGQAFFVEAEAAGNVTFNNSMRSVSNPNTQFFKTKPNKSKSTAKNRLWLNLENNLGMFSQQLIGYFDNATLGYDIGYDGLLNDGGNYINFYSFIDKDTYKIQARSVFDETDQVKLGYSTAIDGKFTITIDTQEGIFTDSQTTVYLEDKLQNIIHNLKKTPYTFTTASGTFNDRFVLRYNDKTLGTNDVEVLESQVIIFNTNKQIKISSAIETIQKVAVYDITGKQLYKKENVSNNELKITNFAPTQQVLLVKISLQNGQNVTKKINY